MAKVLVIEDDELVSRMYNKALLAFGHEVEMARNGIEGLEKAKSFGPDIVLCDVMMPEMNGLEVLRTLKKDKQLKNIPVVMLTNLSGTYDAKMAKEGGACDYLVKSEYRPMEIAKKIVEYLT